jgi:hypothetical protein
VRLLPIPRVSSEFRLGLAGKKAIASAFSPFT